MPPSTPRLNSLTSLRYFAALAVVVTHVNPHYLTSGILRSGANYGYVGVSFFYLLSGFVLTWSCSTQAPAKFWWNRFSRVWPLMATMMVLAYVLFWQLEKHPAGPFGYSLQAVLAQSWNPDPNVYAGGDGPVWSLSCEMFFYLMFPLIVLAVRRLRAPGLVLAAAAVIGAMIAAPLAAGPHVSPATYVWLFFYLPGYRIGEFIIGMLVARAVALGLRLRFPSVGYLLGSAGLAVWIAAVTRYTISHGGPAPQPFVALLAMPCFVLLLIAGASADLSGRARVLSMWLPVRLGEWSFALYLVHPLTAALVGTRDWLAGATAWASFGYLVLFLTATTLVAAGAHYALEKPVERWLRRRYPGKRTQARVPVAPAGTAVPTADALPGLPTPVRTW